MGSTSPWETPFAEVVSEKDMLIPDNIYKDYKEGPDQGKIWQQGYDYIKKEFPNLDYMDYCKFIFIFIFFLFCLFDCAV